MVKYSNEIRLAIVKKLQLGETQRAVSREFKMSQTSVRDLWKKYQATGKVENLKRSGRPATLTNREKRVLCRECVKDPFQSAKAVNLRSNIPKKVSLWTVQRVLRAGGLLSRIAVKKPFLSKCNIAKRKKWCKEYSTFEPVDWSNVIFSDECRMQMMPTRRRLVRRRKGTRLQTNLVCHTMKYGGYSIMVWGAIKADGSRALIKCPITLNSSAYQVVLENGLAQLYDANNTFMQDNAPCHKSASTLAYLERKKVCLLSDWPPQSPDLNIIENLWAQLKRKVIQRNPRNAGELWTFAKEEWDCIPNDAIQKLYQSIPKRLNAVLRNHGRHCKY
jgi:transposase